MKGLLQSEIDFILKELNITLFEFQMQMYGQTYTKIDDEPFYYRHDVERAIQNIMGLNPYFGSTFINFEPKIIDELLLKKKRDEKINVIIE